MFLLIKIICHISYIASIKNDMKKKSNIPCDKTITLINESITTVNKIESLSKQGKDVFIDLLNRIMLNCQNLNELYGLPQNHLTVRLLQRSIIGDLITFLFFLTLIDDENDFNAALNVLNVQSKKSLEKWLKAHYEIDKSNSGQGEKYITQEEYLEEFNDYCDKTILTNDKNKTSAKLKKGTFSGQISQMEDLTKGSEIGKAIHYLHAEYRFLSQVEHYSLFNRGYSYYHNKIDTIEPHRKAIEFCIRYLYESVLSLV